MVVVVVVMMVVVMMVVVMMVTMVVVLSRCGCADWRQRTENKRIWGAANGNL